MATASLFFGHVLSDEQQGAIQDRPLTKEDCVDAIFHDTDILKNRLSIAVADTLFEVGVEPESLPVQYVNKEKLDAFNAFVMKELGLPRLKATDSNWYLAVTEAL